MRLILALLLLAAPALAQMTALPPDVQAAIRAVGPTMGAEGVGRTGEALRPIMPANPEPTLRDARYGPDPRNRLDVFSPGAGSRPVVVFVHGGGFTGGDKTRPGVFYYDNIAGWAVRNSMVGVNITYRLAPAHQWPAVTEDIGAAVAWVRANIAVHGGDPRRIVLMGHSAGAAHVADYLAGHAQEPGVTAAVLVSGVYDPVRFPPGAPERAYYGTDPSLYPARASAGRLSRVRIPLLLAIAELEPPGFRDQGAALNRLLCGTICPTFLDLAGHNHFSPVFGIGSGDRELTDAILTLAQRSTP